MSKSNACLVIEKKKKRTIVVLWFFFFWLYILACILCCLSALINIHALVYKTSNCVANSCFGKFSLQITFKFKAPCGRKWTKGLPNVWPRATVSPCMPSNSNHLLIVGISQVLCMCSDILHPYEFLSCPKNIVSQIGVRNSLSAASGLSPAPYKSLRVLVISFGWGFFFFFGRGGIKAQFDLFQSEAFPCPRRIYLAVEGLDTNLACFTLEV